MTMLLIDSVMLVLLGALLGAVFMLGLICWCSARSALERCQHAAYTDADQHAARDVPCQVADRRGFIYGQHADLAVPTPRRRIFNLSPRRR